MSDAEQTLQSLRRKGWIENPDGSWSPGPRRAPVGGVEAGRPERSKVPALDGGSKQRKAGAGRLAVRVVLISCRHRLTDDDGVAASLKPVRDAVAASLGLDDADRRIKFECEQHRTDGEEGVIVKVEMVSV